MSDDAIPVGEGWARHNNELLVHPPSQVYFAQRGDQRGKYLLKTGEGFSVCPAPHVGRLANTSLGLGPINQNHSLGKRRSAGKGKTSVMLMGSTGKTRPMGRESTNLGKQKLEPDVIQSILLSDAA